MSDGAIYIITKDERYVNLLAASAASLKRVMPNLPITVFSQFPVSSPNFDNVIPVNTEGDGFYDKARLMLDSPYDRTLFLDADIYVAEPVPELFALLDRFDCAATHEEYLNTDWFNDYSRPDVPISFPEFNTGVLAFKRSSDMQRVLQEWSRLYNEFLKINPNTSINDQPFFRVAAYHGDARIATLGREYNCKFRGQGYLNGPLKVLHGHVKFKMNLPHIERVLRIMNSSMRPRVYIAGKVYEQHISGRLWGHRKARKLGSFPEPQSIFGLRIQRLRELIRERGILRLIAKATSLAVENCLTFGRPTRPRNEHGNTRTFPAVADERTPL
jgi:hypothetical protein